MSNGKAGGPEGTMVDGDAMPELPPEDDRQAARKPRMETLGFEAAAPFMDREPRFEPDFGGVGTGEKTAAMSLDELRAAGLDLGDDEPVEKTMAMDAAAMGLLDDAPDLSADAGAAEDEAPEKTMAMEAMEALASGTPSFPGGAEPPPEKTMAMGVDSVDGRGDGGGFEKTQAMDLGQMGGAEGSDPAATMMLESPVAAPAPPPPTLKVQAGNDQGKGFPIVGRSLLVGRGLDCEVVLNDASVSRKHFRLDQTGAVDYTLVDLGSGNGSRINGGRVQTHVMRDGDRIEIGTTTMIWSQPRAAAAAAASAGGWSEGDADRTQIGAMAAMEMLPDWEPRPQAEAPAAAAQGGGKGRIVALAVGLLLLAASAFVVTDKVAGLGLVFAPSVPAPVSAPVAAAPDPKLTEALEVMDEGRALFREQKWDEARARFKEAEDLHAEVPGLSEALDRVDEELASWGKLKEAEGALEEQKYAEALTATDGFREASSYYPTVQELRSQARDLLVEVHLGEAREREEAGELENALAAVERALRVAPDDADALAMREVLKFAMAAGDKPEVAAAVAKPTGTGEPRPARRPQRRATTVDFGPGKASYAAGDFMAAVDFFDGIANGKASKADAAKAKQLANATMSFEGSWTRGMTAAKGFQAKEAVDHLLKASKLDKSISGAYQARISKELSKQFAYLANTAYASKSFGQAGKYARKALAYDGGQTAAQKIYDELQLQAGTWLSEAKQLKAADPYKASGLLRRVIDTLPSDDARHREALALLNEVEASMSE